VKALSVRGRKRKAQPLPLIDATNVDWEKLGERVVSQLATTPLAIVVIDHTLLPDVDRAALSADVRALLKKHGVGESQL
jgi:hypothetical protein